MRDRYTGYYKWRKARKNWGNYPLLCRQAERIKGVDMAKRVKKAGYWHFPIGHPIRNIVLY